MITLLRLFGLAIATAAILLASGGLIQISSQLNGAVLILSVVAVVLVVFFSRRRHVEPANTAAAVPQPAKATGNKRVLSGLPELSAALRTCRSAFIAVALFSGVSNLLMLSGSIYMLEIYDRVLPSKSVPTLVGLTILIAILYTGQGLIDFVRSRVLVRVGNALDESLGARVYSTVLKVPLTFGRSREGMQPVRDLDNVRGFLSGLGPSALFDLPWLPVYLAVIFAFHVILGVTALAGAIVLVILTIVAERLTRDGVKAVTKASFARGGIADAGYRNAEVIAALGMATRFGESWKEINRDYLEEQRRVSDIAGGFGAVSKVLRMMLQSAMLGIGAWLVIEQQATAGIIIAASILAGRALAPVDLAIANWKGFTAALQGWQRLGKLLELMPEEAERLSLPAPCRYVATEAMSVAAPATKKTIVHDATFAVEAGHVVAVIGPSGSGKSSLVRGLVGAWQPSAGRVKLDGADLDQWSADERGRHIGYLPQDVELFAGTVADNIARFELEPDPALIISAAKSAGAHDLIVGFRDGYHTQIGEQGEALSAGQRQRIALARALYRDPFFVVLDEPNSNLDNEGEQALNQALMSVKQRGGIVILVAHRSSVLVTVDFVLAMNQGRIQAFGPKDEILAAMYSRPQPAVAGSAQGPRLRLAAEQSTNAAAKGH